MKGRDKRMKLQMSVVEDSCWFFHKWEVKKDTGFTVYSKCKKCSARKIEQPEGQGYQPIDSDWLNGEERKNNED